MIHLYLGVGEEQSPVCDHPGCAGRPIWWDWLCCPRRDLLALRPSARQLLAWQFCFQRADLGENTSFGASFETDHQGLWFVFFPSVAALPAWGRNCRWEWYLLKGIRKPG